MRQFDAALAGPRIAVPTLVVHDRTDSVNCFADGQAYADAIGDARLMATDKLGHRAMLKDADLIEAVVSFAQPSSSAPSSSVPVMGPVLLHEAKTDQSDRATL